MLLPEASELIIRGYYQFAILLIDCSVQSGYLMVTFQGSFWVYAQPMRDGVT